MSHPYRIGRSETRQQHCCSLDPSPLAGYLYEPSPPHRHSAGAWEGPTLSDAPKELLTLAGRFERNIESYRSSTYNETQVRREIRYTDNEIDQLVYELYGLTEKEIGVVEEATQANHG